MVNEGKIVNGGLEFYATQVTSVYDYMAIGTGSTASSLTDAALGAEAQRIASTNSTTGSPATTAHFDATFTLEAALTYAEFGLFDAAADGNMYFRGTYSGLPLEVGDKIKFEVDVSHANAA